MTARCACNRASEGVVLPRTGAHYDPHCAHSTLWFTTVLMPLLARLQRQRKGRGRVFVDAHGTTTGLTLLFPRERGVVIPVVYGRRVRGTKSTLGKEAA